MSNTKASKNVVYPQVSMWTSHAPEGLLSSFPSVHSTPVTAVLKMPGMHQLRPSSTPLHLAFQVSRYYVPCLFNIVFPEHPFEYVARAHFYSNAYIWFNYLTLSTVSKLFLFLRCSCFSNGMQYYDDRLFCQGSVSVCIFPLNRIVCT